MNEPQVPGYFWFREVTNSEKKEWVVAEVIDMDGPYSLYHCEWVEEVGDGEEWEPEWRGPIPKPSEEGD